jgi:endogenous inhibitor of DNA gyrase (YacG/DUF329 family)
MRKLAQKAEQTAVGNCEYCGRLLERKQRGGRLPKFCSSACRVNHWRKAQKNNADNDTAVSSHEAGHNKGI